ncbi:MAG: hypothetical protein GEV08_05490 [Acidimicrobiia bacterium]|nr:hypothetical protein [Acidimicrobiia bacterium]
MIGLTVQAERFGFSAARHEDKDLDRRQHEQSDADIDQARLRQQRSGDHGDAHDKTGGRSPDPDLAMASTGTVEVVSVMASPSDIDLYCASTCRSVVDGRAVDSSIHRSVEATPVAPGPVRPSLVPARMCGVRS